MAKIIKNSGRRGRKKKSEIIIYEENEEESLIEERKKSVPKKKEVSKTCVTCGKDCDSELGRRFINDVRYCHACYEIESAKLMKKNLKLREDSVIKRW